MKLTFIRTITTACLAGALSITSLMAGRGGGLEEHAHATWKDSNEADGPVYQWVDISSTGMEVLGHGDTSRAATVDLEVPVRLYYEIDYGYDGSQLVVSENGYITSDRSDNGTDSSNDCGLPVEPSNGAGIQDDRLYVLHDDLDFAPPIAGDIGRGRIVYQYLTRSPHPHNDCGVHVFSWLNMDHDSPGTDRFDFQALIFDNSDILLQYGPGNPENGSGSTTGIQYWYSSVVPHTDDNRGLEIACDTSNSIPDNHAILIQLYTLEVDLATDDEFSHGSTTIREAIDLGARKIIFDPALDGAVIERNVLEGRSPYYMSALFQAIDASALPNGITFSGVDSLTLFNVAVRAHFDNITFLASSDVAMEIRDDTTITIHDCRFSQNGGRAIDSLATYDIKGKVTDTTFLGNTSEGNGGAIKVDNNATWEFWNCRFSANEADGEGGAIYISGSNTELHCFEDCSFIQNVASGGPGAAVACVSGTFHAYDTSFRGNESPANGAFWNLGGSSHLERCTFSSNETLAAIAASGGSSFLYNCTISGTLNGYALTVANGHIMSMAHCTVAENDGGLEAVSSATLIVGHTILWQNGLSSGASGGGSIASAGYNILDDNTTHFSSATDDLENTEAMLLPLGANGGYNRTHALPAASPAIDAGALMPSVVLDTDQRGYDRIVDGDGNGVDRVDIGAYEFVGAVIVDTADDEELDPGTGTSLREALDQVGGGGVIQFDAALDGATISLGSIGGGQDSPLSVDLDVTIDASSLADGIIISGGQQTGVMTVDGSNLTLINATLEKGSTTGDGAGLQLINGSDATLIDCTVRGCTSDDGRGGGIYASPDSHLYLEASSVSANKTTESSAAVAAHGGAIYIDEGASLTADSSMIFNNTTPDYGGGIYAGFGAFVDLAKSTLFGNEAHTGGAMATSSGGQHSLTQATFSGNEANFDVGAILLGSPCVIAHCTIVDNRCGTLGSGGITIDENGSSLTHSILAGNRGAFGLDNINPTLGHSITSLGHNAVDKAELPNPQSSDLIGPKPHLAPLAFYGGLIQTQPPLAISPVIDAGDPSIGTDAPDSDARGFDRIANGQLTPQIARIDIGAVEAGQAVVVNTEVDTNNGGSVISLREAIQQVSDGQRILFDPALDGDTISLISANNGQDSPLNIDHTVQIDATQLRNGIEVSGGNQVRVFAIQADQDVALHAVSIRDGDTGSRGGGVRSLGNLVITHACIHNNHAQGHGGGISADGGTLRLYHCTVSNNSCGLDGGAIILDGGTPARLWHCTIAENSTTHASHTGGLALGDGSAQLHASLFANNTNASGLDSFSAATSIADQIKSQGYNLVDVNATSAFDGPGDLPGSQPMLQSLTDLGGWSKGHNLSSGSPAINAANPLPSLLEIFDGRGFLRNAQGRPDIGAAEFLGLTEDADSDGIADYWELLYGLDPSDPNDAAADPDNDGDDNLTEYQNGSHPLVTPFSVFPDIVMHSVDNDIVQFTFTSDPAFNYEVKHSYDHQSWTVIMTIPGAGDFTSVSIDLAAHGLPTDRGFFVVDFE